VSRGVFGKGEPISAVTAEELVGAVAGKRHCDVLTRHS
jgi:hypothetical protein